jgi:hypothetical protein
MKQNNTEWKLEELEVTFDDDDTNDDETNSKDKQDNA